MKYDPVVMSAPTWAWLVPVWITAIICVTILLYAIIDKWRNR